MKKQIRTCLIALFAITFTICLTMVAACGSANTGTSSGSYAGAESASSVGSNICYHSWQEATCTAPKTCTKCSATTGKRLGHDFIAGVCSRCGIIEENSSIGGNDSSVIVPDSSIEDSVCLHEWLAATCLKPQTCAKCGETVGEANETHAIGNWIIDKNATCKAQGSKHKECIVCGETVEKEIIEKTNEHVAGEWIIDKNATCKAQGNKHKECTVCGATMVNTVIEKTNDHIAGEWIIDKKATCNVQGSKHKECTVCGVTMVNTVIEKTNDHVASDWIIDKTSTCKVQGSKHKECTACKTVLLNESIPFEHAFSMSYIKEEHKNGHSGTGVFVCGSCGLTEDQTVPLPGHTEVIYNCYLIYTGASFCEQQYQIVTTCESCDYWVESEVFQPKGHTYTDWTVAKAPTSTADGTIARKCMVCDVVDGEQFVEKMPSFNSEEGQALIVATEANTNCLQSRKGKYTYTAQDGTKFEYDVTIPASAAHKLANGEEISLTAVYELGAKAAKGDKTYAELGLEWASDAYETCEVRGGQGLVKCAECGQSVVVAVKNSHANVTEDESARIESTCDVKGEKTVTCDDCDESWSEELPLREHNYKCVLTNPTTDEKTGIISGTLSWTCQYADCGDSYFENVTGLTKTIVAATWQAAGRTVYTYVENGEAFVLEVTIKQLAHTATVTLVAGGTETIEIDYIDLNKYVFEESDYSELTCSYIVIECDSCKKPVTASVYNPNGPHANVTVETYVEATCDKEGLMISYCEYCGASVKEILPLREHILNCTLSNEVTAADGTLSGTLSWACLYRDCDYTGSEEVTDLTTTVTPATCQASGKIVYTYVKNGETITREGFIPQLAHTATVTLVAGGTQTIEIDLNEVYDLSKYAIEVSGNSNLTCADGEAVGLIDCLTCQKWFIVKVIKKHTAPKGYVYKTPTCSAQYDEFTCTVCGQQAHEAVEVLKHEYTYELKNIDVKAKTATLVKICRIGGEYIQLEKVTNLTSKVVKEATCTSKAVIEYTYTDESGKQGFMELEGDYAPHYFADGTEMVLSGKVYTVGDHGIVASGTVTCMQGVGLADCKVCTQTISVYIKGPHTEDATTVKKEDPTCEKDGYYHYTCLNCGEQVQDEVNNPSKYAATGHKYSYSVRTEPTTKAAGSLIGKCKNCENEVTVTLPALSSKDYKVTATCTVKQTYTWNNKDYGVFTFTDGVRVGHTTTFVSMEYSETTINENGETVQTDYIVYYCEKCGNYIRDIVKQTIIN